MSDLFQGIVSDTTVTILSNCWTVPAGIVALYFYGRLHFNSPTYPIELIVSNGRSGNDRARLITQAPPIFTTRRSRYNSYALRYIGVLELSFIVMVFGYPIIRDIARADGLTLPDLTNESVQYRSIFALFLLTGLLSSFPGFKQIDFWLLSTLHRAAFIPDDVRNFASKLCQSKYTPSPNAIAVVRSALAMRDTLRVADHGATGTLERRIFDYLCLRTQIQMIMSEDRYRRVSIQFAEDLAAITNQAQNLKSEIIAYLRSQERLVPPDVPDIDAYIANNFDKEGIRELLDRRNDLQLKCDIQYELLCLVTGLTLFATTSAYEEINRMIQTLGFEKTKIDSLPILDWDAIMKVTGSAILILLLFNGVYALLWSNFGLFSSLPGMAPSKDSVFRFAVLFTFAYTIIMWMAITLKRKWRHRGPIGRDPENLLIAACSYFATIWINFVINYYVTSGHVTYAPVLFAVNQAVFGYFIGRYIDRLVTHRPLSFRLSAYQGVAQAIAMLIAVSLAPTPISGSNIVEIFRLTFFISLFSMLQAGISGFVAGALFQYIYSQSSNTISTAVAQEAPQAARFAEPAQS
jgi:hypothetical protein